MMSNEGLLVKNVEICMSVPVTAVTSALPVPVHTYYILVSALQVTVKIEDACE